MSRIIVKNLPKDATESQLKQFFSVKGEVTDVKLLKDADGNFRRVAFVGFRNSNEEESMVRFFNNNYIGTSKVAVEPAKSTTEKVRSWSKPKKKEFPEIKLPENIDSTRLFLRNLPYTVQKEDLELLFSEYGEIEELSLPMDSTNHRPKGFAYIKFKNTESAVVAFDKLDRSVFQGRLLHIIPAEKKPEPVVEIKAKSSYKYQLLKELKQKAKNTNTWNTLFVNPDTVASVMAGKLHLTKGEFLDKDHNDLAVRIAMAETKILEEIKQWMETNDINYEAFKGDRNTTPRSDTVVIAKNLPKNAVASEIQEIFSRFGKVTRCVMPLSKTMAIIEFKDPGQARNAFENLSYTTYKTLPLYLEWAPLTTFETPSVETEQVTKANVNTLFIKNLSFKTTKESLKSHFDPIGGVKSIRIITNNGLPCGYGFIEFENQKFASKALRSLNNSTLDGHALKLSESNTTIQLPKKRPRTEEVLEDDNRLKILVKNLAFEANVAELKEIFQNFGEVKSVRIPTKVSGGHRGFGFVEYLSHQDAANALQSLQNTHFYGRRLVLEWSKEDSTLSSIKQKA
jgi:multiple RNA-binding domain-containing protein 1